jgi:hypothetical protein
MSSIQMLGTPGHLVSGGAARVGVQGNKPGYGRIFALPRRVDALTAPNTCRSVRERSP